MTDTFVVDDRGKPTITKDPNAILDYTFDWSEWLDAIPDLILPSGTRAEFPLASEGIVVDSFEVVDDRKVTVWVSGGTLGKKAQLTCRIHTVGLRQDDRSVYMRIKDR